MKADAHTLAMDQLRLGDHAFAEYADDELRWELPGVFVGHGLASGHQVMILPDPAVPHDDVFERMVSCSGAAEQGLMIGQLSITSMRELVYPERRFTAQRQMARLREETQRARRKGFAGLRTFIDMAWVRDFGVDIEAVMRREASAGELFANRDYAEVCSYDRRHFPREVLEAMWASHPVALLERPGELRGYGGTAGWHLIGDADIATRQSFRSLLHAALDGVPGGETLLDLSRLCFMSLGCASDLLRLARESGRGRIVVRCSCLQASVLRRLGSAEVPGLVLDETAEEP